MDEVVCQVVVRKLFMMEVRESQWDRGVTPAYVNSLGHFDLLTGIIAPTCCQVLPSTNLAPLSSSESAVVFAAVSVLCQWHKVAQWYSLHPLLGLHGEGIRYTLVYEDIRKLHGDRYCSVVPSEC